MSDEHPDSMTLSALCAGAGLDAPDGAERVTLSGVTGDSRRVRPGSLFVAVTGAHTDARRLIPDAIRAGAAAVACEAPAPDGVPVPVLIVPDARAALSFLLDAWYGHPGRRLRLVGVTGTNGKTSVSSMLRHVLTAAGYKCGLIGTVGCLSPSGERLDERVSAPDASLRSGMTTPDPEELYAMLDVMSREAPDERPFVVMEVTSHALALGKVCPLTFELAVFTNLTPEHLDFHGTMDAYYAAKRLLFTKTRAAVVNVDDAYGRRLITDGLPVETWYACRTARLPDPGLLPPEAEDAALVRSCASDVRTRGADGVEFLFTSPDARMRLSVPVPGLFSVSNAHLCCAAALALGVPPLTVRDALRAFPGVPGRMERVTTTIPTDFSVFIDFAHTPDALEKVLGVFVQLRREASAGSRHTPSAGCPVRRIVLVFGCGGDRDRSKRKAMGRVASMMADSIVITSDNSRSEDPDDIIREILAGVDKESEYAVIPDRRAAIREVIRLSRPGDVILLCGKGHETYEIDRAGKRPFCEAEIVREAVEAFARGERRE